MARCEECLHFEVCEALEKGNGLMKVSPIHCGCYKPTTEVVEVVRCKDCIHYKQNQYANEGMMMCKCWANWLPTDPDDFCSYGEKKL